MITTGESLTNPVTGEPLAVGDESAHFVCEVRPALGFERLVETMFGLAAGGKVDAKGLPHPLRLAVVAGMPIYRAALSAAGSAPRRMGRSRALAQRATPAARSTALPDASALAGA